MRTVFAAMIAGLLMAGNVQSGVRYSAMLSVKHELGNAMDTSKINVWIGGGKAKAEYVETTIPGIEPGDSLLSLDGGKTAILVNPREKTTASCEVDPIFGVLRGGQPEVVLPYETTYSDLKVEKLEENGGESVAGHATVHYRFRISYTATGQRRRGVVSTTRVIDYEVWSVPELSGGEPRSWPARVPLEIRKKDFGDTVEKALAVVRGLPVKALTVQTITNNDGQERITEGRFEVMELEVVDVPEEVFAVPPDFQKGEFHSNMASDPTNRGNRPAFPSSVRSPNANPS
jgi:hypothetical protein